MVDGEAELTPTRALQQLEESRSFLQRLIGAASSIEGLKYSIEDMLAQGDPTSDDQPQMARFIEGLGRKVRNMSNAEVVLRLEKLDRRISGLFARLLPVIERISAGDVPFDDHLLNESSNDIGALKRLSRTALAIRGMLARRGVAIPDFRLPLDRVQLQKKLFAIAREEQRARREVIQQVREMGSDIRAMLGRVDLPEVMRHLLDQMQAGLLANLEHLRAGHSVAELPLPIEEASFNVPLPQDSGVLEGQAPLTSPEPSAEDQTGTLRTPRNQAAPTASPSLDGMPPPGLLKTLWLWVKSPWDVSWQDIRQGRYRG